MTGDEYQRLAARTINPNNSTVENLLHGILGISAEAGEFLGLFQKLYQGHEIDSEHAGKELGDILWTIAEVCTCLGWSMDDIMALNIKKLQERYPNGFETEKSIHRKEGDV